MTIVAEEVPIEVETEPIDQCFDTVTVTILDEGVQGVDLVSLAVGSANDAAVFEVRNKENLAHEQFS